MLSPRAVQKNISGLNFPSVVGKLKKTGWEALVPFGDNCKKADCVPVVSGDMAVPDDRQGDIFIVQRQPLVCEVGAELL